MSPNNKQNLSNSDLEDNIQDNINLNEYIQISSDDDDDQILNNGYTLLNQDLDQQNNESNDDNDSQNENSEDNENKFEDNTFKEFAEMYIHQSDQIDDIQSTSNTEPTFKSYLNNQFHIDEVLFQREYDKKEFQDNEFNRISLSKGNFFKVI
jgi:hypothetical protein